MHLRKIVLLPLLFLASVQLLAETMGSIDGRIRDARNRRAVEAVNILISGDAAGTASDKNGKFFISELPPGSYVLKFTAVGYETQEITNVEVSAGQSTRLDILLRPEVIAIEQIFVYGVSKKTERILDAPAAVSKISGEKLQDFVRMGQPPSVFSAEPAIDVVQSGLNDFNVNTRGFNTTLNRRVLVLQDNRDTAMALLLAQEWNTLSMPLSDFGQIEFVRGPASALYGANAFSGVINLKTPDPEHIKGTRVTLAAGELNSIRGDLRHAGFQGQWGYKFNFGGFRNGTWSRSRNVSQKQLDTREYFGLTPEELPLADDDLSAVYGTARLDYNLNNGDVFTLESGVSQAEDQVYVTNIGRIQVDAVVRPWSRFSFASERFFFQADYNGRKTLDGHQRALNTGAVFKENSADFHFQFQHNVISPDRKWRLVWGGSHKFQNVDTRRTFTLDTYHENLSGLFGQVDFQLSRRLKAVFASRIDRSTLHTTQFSPKLTLIAKADESHVFRIAFSQAFQAPDYAEFFMRTIAGPPRDLAGLEQDIELAIEKRENLPRGSVDLPLGFGFTPFLAIGNENLEVERVDSYELGYKGRVLSGFHISADFFYNQLRNFVTDLLPGVNPTFQSYQLPEGLPESWREIAESFLMPEIKAGLSRMPDGSDAFVISHTNFGKVNQWGIELSADYVINSEIKLLANYSYYEYDVRDVMAGDALVPNTPAHKYNISAIYQGLRGINLMLHYKYVDAFDWASGVFAGRVPAYGLFNLHAGYKFAQRAGLNAAIMNVFNNEHYELFGGSLNGRRAVLSVSFDF